MHRSRVRDYGVKPCSSAGSTDLALRHSQTAIKAKHQKGLPIVRKRAIATGVSFC